MKKQHLVFAAFLSLLLFITPSLSSASNRIVELTVTETAGIARISEPVTSGIPLPSSLQIKDASALRLVDSSGGVIPAQFSPLARWGSSPNNSTAPIKWLLIDFQASLQPNGSAKYYLQTSGAEPAYPTLMITETASEITINTGVATFSLSKSHGRLNGPGLSEPLLGELFAPSGNRYTTTGSATVSIALNGKLRASVEVEGAYRDESGGTLLYYSSRYWFYAGQSYVRLFHTVENRNAGTLGEYGQFQCQNIGSEGSVSFADLSFMIPANLSPSITYRVGGDQEVTGTLANDLSLYQDSSGTNSWNCYVTLTDWDGNPLNANPRMQSYVSFKGYRISSGGTTLNSGNQAEGWVALSDADGSWGVAVRDFWQNFPKALRVSSSGQIEIGLFPGEFGPPGYSFNFRAGEHKTHEILLYPNSGTGSLHKSFSHPLFAKASPEWYVESGALGLTAQINTAHWPDLENYLNYQLTTSPNYEEWFNWYPNLYAALEDTDFYGIFDYGDVPIDYEGYLVAPMNPKYHMDLGMWMQWARGGDQRWFALAEAADRHIADIDVLHTLHTPRHWSDGAMFGHSEHDEAGFINPHRNINSGNPDTIFGVPGLLLTYYLTGYEKAYDGALEIADNIEFNLHNDNRLSSYYPDSNGNGFAISEVDGNYANNSRPAANCLHILVEAYRATADSRYLTATDALVDWAKASSQPFIHGPTGGTGENDFMSPQMLNLYSLALGNYLTMREEFSLADTYNATGSLLAYQNFLRTYVWIPLADIETGARGAYPYHWYFDGRTGIPGEENDNHDPVVCNFLLLGADAMAYAYHFGGDADYFERATRLFRTGSRDPFFEGDANTYSATKELANSVFFGHVFLHEWASDPGLNPTGVTTTLTAIPNLSIPITVTISAQGSGNLYYRFFVGNDYGARWTEIQPWSASNACTYTPADEDNYLIVAHLSDHTSGARLHQAGFSLATSNHTEAGVVINNLTSNLAFPQPKGTPITFTAQAIGRSVIYYKFWYKRDGGFWEMIQNWSTSNTATWTPTQGGDYTVVVWGSEYPAGGEPNPPIAGFTCTIEE